MKDAKKPIRKVPGEVHFTGTSEFIFSPSVRSRAKTPPKAKDLAADFFAHLGYAINQWAYVDAALFALFRFALNANSDTVAARVYYRSSSLSDHLVLTSSLMEVTLANRLKTRWKALFDEFQPLASFRNRLAHDPSTHVSNSIKIDVSGRTNPVPATTFWEISVERTKLAQQTGRAVQKPITVEAIKRHIADVAALQEHIEQFKKLLPARARTALKTTPLRSSPKAKPKRTGTTPRKTG